MGISLICAPSLPCSLASRRFRLAGQCGLSRKGGEVRKCGSFVTPFSCEYEVPFGRTMRAFSQGRWFSERRSLSRQGGLAKRNGDALIGDDCGCGFAHYRCSLNHRKSHRHSVLQGKGVDDLPMRSLSVKAGVNPRGQVCKTEPRTRQNREQRKLYSPPGQ